MTSSGWFDPDSLEFTIHMVLFAVCLFAISIVLIVYICQIVCDKQSGKRDWKSSRRFIPEPSFRRLDSVCETEEPRDNVHQRYVAL